MDLTNPKHGLLYHGDKEVHALSRLRSRITRVPDLSAKREFREMVQYTSTRYCILVEQNSAKNLQAFIAKPLPFLICYHVPKIWGKLIYATDPAGPTNFWPRARRVHWLMVLTY